MSGQNSLQGGPLDDSEERAVIFATLDSFRQNLYALQQSQWQVLAAPPFNILNNFNLVDDALDSNADIADAILELGLRTFSLPTEPEKNSILYWHGTANPSDLTKAHSTIRQFYRDWSKQGFEAEVEPLLKLVLEDLSSASITPIQNSKGPRVLLPGAGLGRILFSLSLHGYNVEGNEISYHQLLASNFILNCTQAANQFTLYPFASTFTNHRLRSNQLRAVAIPDIHPATEVTRRRTIGSDEGVEIGEMNMTAGDFITSYNELDSHCVYDAVVTIYFIDTAPNLIKYIETVRNCLKEGGVWINIGPLLWHFDDRVVGKSTERSDSSSKFSELQLSVPSSKPEQPKGTGIEELGSFELADEEVLHLLDKMGFDVLQHEYTPAKYGGYIQDPCSMIQNRYECSHWVARKRPQ